jgi:hypothetical protein
MCGSDTHRTVGAGRWAGRERARFRLFCAEEELPALVVGEAGEHTWCAQAGLLVCGPKSKTSGCRRIDAKDKCQSFETLLVQDIESAR